MHRLDPSPPAPLTPNATPEARVVALEGQLRQARERIAELESRDGLKTQLLANISHDLRTPLTAVITHAEILRDGILGELTPRQLDSICGIINGGRQLLGQVGEILTYARGAADQLTVTRTHFPLDEVVQQLMTLNESLARRKGLRLVVDIPHEMEPVHADREKVSHIIGNLIGNAIDFTPEGGQVWVSARRTPARCPPPPARAEAPWTGASGGGVRNGEVEAAPRPELALQPDAPAVQLHQLARDRQAKPGAVVRSRGARVDLRELLEDQVVMLGVDPNAGVTDLHTAFRAR